MSLPDPLPEAGFGIYLHWPFCEAKCPYCDFNSHVSAQIDQTIWRDAYLAEIDRYAREFPDQIVSSVFFGGGTPSLMPPDLVAALLDKISACWRVTNDPEITLEANPSSVEADRFAGFRSAGVNRVSLGVQALNDTDLKRLGRLHSVEDAKRALQIAQATFDRASFDLIYARQDQSLDDWRAELETALSFGFSHMSLYQLTVEPGTAFGDRQARGLLRGLPNDDASADMYDLTLDMCDAAGLPMYEVSNYAAPDEQSRHNLTYWRGGTYLGIGPGAHGRVIDAGGARCATSTELSPAKWVQDVKNGSGEQQRDVLAASDQASEYALMSLRLREGMSVSKFNALADEPLAAGSVQSLIDMGAVDLLGDRLIVQKQYVNVLNSVVAELLRGQ